MTAYFQSKDQVVSQWTVSALQVERGLTAIVWSGLGILVAVITVGGLFFAEFATETFLKDNE